MSPPEPRLGQLERDFATLQRLARVGSWEWDVRADAIRWSDELYRIFGVEPETFKATYEAYLEHIHPEDRDMVHRTVQEAYETGSGYAFDHRVVRPDGSVRWVHGRGAVDMDEADSPVRLYGVAMDITDRKRTEEVLREFVATAAHELRTPVASIVHALELLRAGERVAPEDEEVFEVLIEQADRLRAVSRDLLDLTAVETRASAVWLESVALGTAVAAVREAVAGSDAELWVKADPSIQVQADEDEIRRVVREVVRTCLAHKAKTIEVRAVVSDQEVALEFAHDGKPIPDEDADEMFLPLVRRAAQAPGAGPGLAVAARLMAAFGGRLEHRSDGGRPRFVLRFAPGR
jgi:PAS domain S-box-containing protein